MQNKIIRTICYFTDTPTPETASKLAEIAGELEARGYLIQTKRLCSPLKDTELLLATAGNVAEYVSMGTLNYNKAIEQLPNLYKDSSVNLNFNLDLTDVAIEKKYIDLLFKIVNEKPSRTFNFTYVFNNEASSPFFPSAEYKKNGFSIGLQPTDLSDGCTTLEAWFKNMEACWQEINEMFGENPEFLGIDSSIAPLAGSQKGSFINFIKRLGYTFTQSTTTDTYVSITRFIKENNPKPVGLCGIMLPCLEDSDLAAEYEAGNFSVERNIYLSLHSGLGIDTYPIGVDEKPERVVEILKLLQALSNKYKKPLSARFVSDGKAHIGQKTNFNNQYLVDCIVRAL